MKELLEKKAKAEDQILKILQEVDKEETIEVDGISLGHDFHQYLDEKGVYGDKRKPNPNYNKLDKVTLMISIK